MTWGLRRSWTHPRRCYCAQTTMTMTALPWRPAERARILVSLVGRSLNQWKNIKAEEAAAAAAPPTQPMVWLGRPRGSITLSLFLPNNNLQRRMRIMLPWRRRWMFLWLNVQQQQQQNTTATEKPSTMKQSTWNDDIDNDEQQQILSPKSPVPKRRARRMVALRTSKEQPAAAAETTTTKNQFNIEKHSRGTSSNYQRQRSVSFNKYRY